MNKQDNKKRGGKYARIFHQLYEKYAPEFGYETKEETKEFNPDSPNGRLMTKVCNEVVDKIVKEQEKDKNEYLEGWKRIKADFANYKKEEADRMKSISRKAQESVFRDMIEVLDSFNMGLSINKGEKIERKEVEIIKSQLNNALKKHRVINIKVEPEDEFDPSKHEAVEEVDSDDISSGSIVEVVEPGYMLKDKVLRPAKVKVSK